MNQDIRNKALGAYEDAISLLDNVFKAHQKYIDPKFDPKAGLCRFDVLLQYSMMQVALYDNQLDREELKLISELSKFANFCDYLTAKGYKDVTWQNLLNANADQLKQIIAEYAKDMVDLNQEFVYVFTVVDIQVTEADLLKQLTNDILFMLHSVAVSDEKYAEDEVYKADCLIFRALEAIYNGIKEYEGGALKEEAKEVKVEDKPVEQRRLKDYYVKKNTINLVDSPYKVNYVGKEKAVAYIETESGSGSGFMITPNGLCFTCFHVVGGAKEIYVRLGETREVREVYKADLIYGCEEEDFAIIQLEDCHDNYFFELEEDYASIKTGDDVAIYGFPYGQGLNEDVMDLEPSLTKGYVASKNKIMGRKCYYLDIFSAPGNSGGPAFALKDNKVIGYLCGSVGSDRANIIYIRSLEYFFENLVKE